MAVHIAPPVAAAACGPRGRACSYGLGVQRAQPLHAMLSQRLTGNLPARLPRPGAFGSCVAARCYRC